MPPSTDPPDTPPNRNRERKQVNVRLPVPLIEQIDARRQVKDMSRDKWVENALRFALQHGQTPSPVVAGGRRTAPPPHRRPL